MGDFFLSAVIRAHFFCWWPTVIRPGLESLELCYFLVVLLLGLNVIEWVTVLRGWWKRVNIHNGLQSHTGQDRRFNEHTPNCTELNMCYCLVVWSLGRERLVHRPVLVVLTSGPNVQSCHVRVLNIKNKPCLWPRGTGALYVVCWILTTKLPPRLLRLK